MEPLESRDLVTIARGITRSSSHPVLRAFRVFTVPRIDPIMMPLRDEDTQRLPCVVL